MSKKIIIETEIILNWKEKIMAPIQLHSTQICMEREECQISFHVGDYCIILNNFTRY